MKTIGLKINNFHFDDNLKIIWDIKFCYKKFKNQINSHLILIKIKIKLELKVLFHFKQVSSSLVKLYIYISLALPFRQIIAFH